MDLSVSHRNQSVCGHVHLSVQAGLVSLCGQIFARVLKAPVTIFVIPGILPLVPGAGMFRIAHSVIRSDGMTSYYIIQTLIVAGMIALSIMVVDSIFRLFLKTKGDCHVDRR